jgi:CO/xanthine dehydrogenase FAD-binding subunit
VRGFDLHVATSLTDALEYLGRFGGATAVLAGGTDLMVRLREGTVAPARVLDISRLGELRRIEVDGDAARAPRLRLGGLVTHGQVETSPAAGRLVPLLAQACATVGSPQIRNRGTLGGNCATASPAGDSLPALLALNAELTLVSAAAGERRVPASSFFVGPGRTAMRADELLSHITVETQREDERSSYLKLGHRRALAISVASAALRVVPDWDGLPAEHGVFRVARVALAFGALAPVPLRGKAAEAALAGGLLNAESIGAAAEAAADEVSPISDLRASAEYRRAMAASLVKMGLEVFMRAGDGVSRVAPPPAREAREAREARAAREGGVL